LVYLGLLKKLNSFARRRFFGSYYRAGGVAFLQGDLEKSGGFVMVFCGEVVVDCWWECGFWTVISQR
jgi:hypothetical protein